MPRFALLEHTGHPDDPSGCHYDLLLEEGRDCQTWRLADLPHPDDLPVAAQPLPPHRRDWLDTTAAEVSGGRGFARRIDAGSYSWLEADRGDRPTGQALRVRLSGIVLRGTLELKRVKTGWAARLSDS
jgi:hypothetical protein